MQKNSLKRKNANTKSVRVGRGGKRGKTAGKGSKGQKSRAGHRMRPELRDIIKKIPRMRGRGSTPFTSTVPKPAVVNVGALEAIAKDNAVITPEVLLAAELIRRQGGKLPAVKILGNGDLSSKIAISGCTVSASAKAKIEKAGGSISE